MGGVACIIAVALISALHVCISKLNKLSQEVILCSVSLSLSLSLSLSFFFLSLGARFFKFVCVRESKKKKKKKKKRRKNVSRACRREKPRSVSKYNSRRLYD